MRAKLAEHGLTARSLVEQAQDWAFEGREPADPKVMAALAGMPRVWVSSDQYGAIMARAAREYAFNERARRDAARPQRLRVALEHARIAPTEIKRVRIASLTEDAAPEAVAREEEASLRTYPAERKVA